MYDKPLSAVLQDFASVPVDEHHERQRKLSLVLTGNLDPAMFADVDPKIKGYAEDINDGPTTGVSFTLTRRCKMEISVGAEDAGEKKRSRVFEEVQLTGMIFKPPKGKHAKRGKWELRMSFLWDKPDIIFIADAHRLHAEVSLERLEDAPESQMTLDEVDPTTGVITTKLHAVGSPADVLTAAEKGNGDA